MKKNQNMKPTVFVLVKGTAVAPKKVVEVMAQDLCKSELVSPLDACTCTGNCTSKC